MLNQWKNWCRLCGKINGAEINVFIKDEKLYNISEAIQKFLSITINISDEFPQRICTLCHEFIQSVLNFTEKTTKIQDMFTEIQLDSLIDLDTLRIKYNLTNQDILLEEKSNEINNFVECDNKRFIEYEEHENDKKKIKVASTINDNIDLNCENSKDPIHLECNYTTDVTSCIKEENLTTNNYLVEDNDKDDLKEYIRKTRKIKKKLKKCILTVDNDEKDFYECEICKKICNSQRGQTLHMKFKHSIEINKEPYSCAVCDKVFNKIQYLTEHKKMHLPPEERKWYPCPHCDKKFAAFWYVSVHIRTIHEKERSYICEECGKAFATGDRLVAHKLVHTDFKPFQCPKCSKCFKCAPSLKHHVDSHEDTKYICSICGIQLNTKRILRRHMIVHSDKKKYKCNFCEKEFKRLDAFKHHLILHTGLRPYHCPFCEQTFANGSNCRKHQKHSHPKELALAEETGGSVHNIIRNIPSMKQLKAVNEEAILDSTMQNKLS